MKIINNKPHRHVIKAGYVIAGSYLTTCRQLITTSRLTGIFSFGLLGVMLCNPATVQAATKKPIKAESTIETVSAIDDAGCLGNTRSPGKLVLPVGKSTMLHLPDIVAHRTVGNPEVVQAKLIAPQTLYLLGINIGTTNMIIQGTKGSCTVIDVTVNMDPDALQQTLAELMPDEKNIKVTAAADSLVLSGTVEDALTASHVLEIAEAFVRRQRAQSAQTFEKDSASGSGGGTVVSFQQGQGSQSASGQGGRSPGLVNLLNINAQQQVMLEVKIAEVSKTLIDKLGASATFGGSKYGLLANFLSSSAGFLGSKKGNGIGIDAENKDGLVKILAEPTIMAISGQEGSFLAGGKIFIPVSQSSNNGIPTIALEEKEFGVGLKFTPTVLAGGRINMKVSPEVSELNKDGVGITASGISGTAILPSFTTRRASTTVQLYDGQSFAIGGLIKNNTAANIKAFPILGEIPIIGALFRSTDFQKDRTELIFVVTPHLVKPLTAGYRLPTDNYSDPNRTEIFLGGRMEGAKPEVKAQEPQAPQPAAPPPSATKEMPLKNEDSGFELK